MPTHAIAAEEQIDAGRGGVVICVPCAASAAHQLAECLRRLIRHTPADVPLLVVGGDSGHHHELYAGFHPAGASAGRLLHVSATERGGVDGLIDLALDVAAPADVVIVDPGCKVGEGWFEGLRKAACADSTVASAGALTTADLGIHELDPSGQEFDAMARAVRARSPRAYPRVAIPGRACVYVRRSAADLVGDVGSGWCDEAVRPSFFIGCIERGLSHVVADDVLVSGFGRGAAPIDRSNEQSAAPLTRSVSAGRRATGRSSIVLDARILDGRLTGTQVHVIELLAALARTRKLRIQAVVLPALGGEVCRALAELPEVELVSEQDAPQGARGDVVHRPFQVSGVEDITFLRRLGERLVVTHQDMIGYRNPSYFFSECEWLGYRRLTRHALAVADFTVFFSNHALKDAMAEDVVDADRARVVPIGVDHGFQRGRQAAARPPRGAPRRDQKDLILCLGTDLRHKNRVFALRVLDQLQRTHSWDGHLVFAGPHLPVGTSADEEARLLARSPRLAGRTTDVGAVDEDEKLWLIKHAGLVLYPTVYEGFGLIPFEASDQGVPCMWAPVASLAELLPAAQAPIIPWDAGATAERAFELLGDPAAAATNVAAIRAAAAGLRWDETAARLIEVYQEACDRPASPGGRLERTEREGLVSEDGLRLVGPNGALAPELERPLLALATHQRLGRPVLGAIKVGYQATHFMRQRARPGRSRDH